jgi:anaerobic ribonucleoside-triphosphate reductase
MANIILKDSKTSEDTTEFMTYHKATVMKSVRYWQKNVPIDQCNRIGSPEIDLKEYSQLIFTT